MTESTQLFTFSRRATLGAAVILGCLIFPGVDTQTAHATAKFERSAPEADAVLNERPTTIEIWFTEAVIADRTWIIVVGPDGARVDRGDFAINSSDADGRHVTVSLRDGLAAGDYTVHWNSSSTVDGKESFGDFGFTLDGAAANCAANAGTPAASPAAVACPGPPPEGPLGSPIAVEDMMVTLEAGSTKAGPIDLNVTIADGSGNPVTDAQVSVRARHLEMDHGEFPQLAESNGEGGYVAADVGMGMGGSWRVAVDVVRPGHDPVTAFFLVDLTGLS
jgi:methionine-rich copper-binding protein CopC